MHLNKQRTMDRVVALYFTSSPCMWGPSKKVADTKTSKQKDNQENTDVITICRLRQEARLSCGDVPMNLDELDE